MELNENPPSFISQIWFGITPGKLSAVRTLEPSHGKRLRLMSASALDPR